MEIVVPAGTDESSTSSSSNTDDLIPDKVRKIFESNGPQDYFKVYYINKDEEIMAIGEWLFEGRDKVYEDVVVVDANGPCVASIVLYEGRTRKYQIKGSLSANSKKGGRARITCKGAEIP